jgi:hypothetical protein
MHIQHQASGYEKILWPRDRIALGWYFLLRSTNRAHLPGPKCLAAYSTCVKGMRSSELLQYHEFDLISAVRPRFDGLDLVIAIVFSTFATVLYIWMNLNRTI